MFKNYFKHFIHKYVQKCFQPFYTQVCSIFFFKLNAKVVHYIYVYAGNNFLNSVLLLTVFGMPYDEVISKKTPAGWTDTTIC